MRSLAVFSIIVLFAQGPVWAAGRPTIDACEKALVILVNQSQDALDREDMSLYEALQQTMSELMDSFASQGLDRTAIETAVARALGDESALPVSASDETLLIDVGTHEPDFDSTPMVPTPETQDGYDALEMVRESGAELKTVLPYFVADILKSRLGTPEQREAQALQFVRGLLHVRANPQLYWRHPLVGVNKMLSADDDNLIDLKAVHFTGQNTLFTAVSYSAESLAEELIEAGVPFDTPAGWSRGVIHVAIENGLSRALTSMGYFGAKFHPGYLTSVSASTTLEALEALERFGLDMTSVVGNRTALFSADTAEQMKFFINRGVPVDAQDGRGNTALVMAVLAKDIPRIKALLDVGADPRIPNNAGQSPFDMVNGSEDLQEVIPLLHEAARRLAGS